MQDPWMLYARDGEDDSRSNLSSAAIAIGTCLVLMMYGQALQEAYHYFRSYPKDGYDLKGLIAALLVFDTFHTVVVTDVCYSTLLVASSLSPDETTTYMYGLWAFWLIAPSAGATLILSHCFFARRVFRLGAQPLASKVLVATTLLAATGVVIYNIVDAFMNKRPGSIIEIMVVLSISLLLDVALTIKLVLYLRRSRTGIRSTDNILNRLVSFSINTGLLTGILTICPIILLAASPVHIGYYPVSAILAPVHTSVVLAAVNSRRSLVDRGSQGVELHSFDLDIAPRPEHRESTSIRFATRSSSPASDPVATRFSVGPAQEVQIRLGETDDDEDARSVDKSKSGAHAV